MRQCRICWVAEFPRKTQISCLFRPSGARFPSPGAVFGSARLLRVAVCYHRSSRPVVAGEEETVELFKQSAAGQIAAQAPLAARMRPRPLDEFVGQEHLVGPGRLLRRAIEGDDLSALILDGPPGTGKTSLAHVIAKATRSEVEQVNAVTAGVADLKQVIARAQERRAPYAPRPILVIAQGPPGN